MATAHATNITPNTMINYDGKAFIVRNVRNTTNHVIFTNRIGDVIVVDKIEEIEVIKIDSI